MKSAIDVTCCTIHVQTIRIRSDDTICANMNTLFGPLFGTKANTNRIFGTSLVLNTLFIYLLIYLFVCLIITKIDTHVYIENR